MSLRGIRAYRNWLISPLLKALEDDKLVEVRYKTAIYANHELILFFPQRNFVKQSYSTKLDHEELSLTKARGRALICYRKLLVSASSSIIYSFLRCA